MGADEAGPTEGVKVGAGVGPTEGVKVGAGVGASEVGVEVGADDSSSFCCISGSFSSSKVVFFEAAEQVSGSAKTCASRSGGPVAQIGLHIS